MYVAAIADVFNFRKKKFALKVMESGFWEYVTGPAKINHLSANYT